MATKVEVQPVAVPVVVATAVAPPSQNMTDGATADVAALLSCDKVKVKQKASLLEAVTQGACEKKNKYKIKAKGGTSDGETLYKAKEKSDCCQRLCCAPGHEATVQFELDDVGKKDDVVYTMYKPFKCACCFSCFDICQSEMTMYRGKWKVGDEPGEVLGRAKEIPCGGVFTPTLDIFNGKNEKVGQMKGPTCFIGSCCDTTFNYFGEGKDGPTGAQIKKEAGNMGKELLTDADTFKVEFEADMDESMRATMMGTQLLLDFMFFEGDGAAKFDPVTQSCEVKLWDWFCCGCTCPCSCRCGGGGGD